MRVRIISPSDVEVVAALKDGDEYVRSCENVDVVPSSVIVLLLST